MCELDILVILEDMLMETTMTSKIATNQADPVVITVAGNLHATPQLDVTKQKTHHNVNTTYPTNPHKRTTHRQKNVRVHPLVMALGKKTRTATPSLISALEREVTLPDGSTACTPLNAGIVSPTEADMTVRTGSQRRWARLWARGAKDDARSVAEERAVRVEWARPSARGTVTKAMDL